MKFLWNATKSNQMAVVGSLCEEYEKQWQTKASVSSWRKSIPFPFNCQSSHLFVWTHLMTYSLILRAFTWHYPCLMVKRSHHLFSFCLVKTWLGWTTTHKKMINSCGIRCAHLTSSLFTAMEKNRQQWKSSATLMK